MIMRTSFCMLLMLVPTLAGAQTSSPFPPPEEKYGLYVVNAGAGLDTGCTFRGGGPLVISLDVPATMNPNELDADGTLTDPSKLIDTGVIGSRAKISFPVFDIDDDANPPGVAPEIDHISFNGERVTMLSGQNNTWTNDSFRIDIGKVRFNTTNEIRIDIDQGNVGNIEAWCMSVDWVSIGFDAAYPFVLAHGIDSSAAAWQGVIDVMDASGVLYTRFSVTPNGSVANNGSELKDLIAPFLENVKAKKVNIIAHSKGGLDSQMLAKLAPPDFEVSSLSTLSTPHLGSVVADISLLQRIQADININTGNDPGGYAADFVNRGLAGMVSGFGVGPQPPGLDDLTTQAATAAIAAGNRGNVANTFTIGADAGPRCSGVPSDEQIAPLADAAPFGTGFYVNDTLRAAYGAICTLASAVEVGVDTQIVVRFVGLTPVPILITTLTYSTVETAMPQPNDVVVGVRSANPGYGTPLGNNAFINHSEVINDPNLQKILDRVIPLR